MIEASSKRFIQVGSKEIMDFVNETHTARELGGSREMLDTLVNDSTCGDVVSRFPYYPASEVWVK